MRQPFIPSLLHPTVPWLLPLSPLDLATHFSRFGENREVPLEESLKQEIILCLPQGKVSHCLTLLPLLLFSVVLVPQAFPWLPS